MSLTHLSADIAIALNPKSLFQVDILSHFKKFSLSLFLLVLLFVSVLFSCDQKDESCPYKLYSDPALFVSYEIDGKPFKYYQQNLANGFGLTMNYNYSSLLFYSAHYVPFTNLDPFQDSINAPQTTLIFNNYTLYNKTENYLFPKLSKIIKPNYPFICPPAPPALKDTILMIGIGIEIKISNLNGIEIYNTEEVMKHYNFNLDSINNFFSNGSYFHIENIEPVCNELYLVTGNFETVFIDKNEPGKKLTITNGRFAFLTQ